ncbi:recombinase family protein [Candidatus Bipolaricaulota bacterium]|nr:recombinase family protein [Candidatus Bipolaricaulota bacterium]
MRRKVVTYLRVSTTEQSEEGYSIESQRRFLRDYAKGHNLEIVREFTEVESAFKPGRPQLEEMRRFLRRHPEIEGVLVYKVDRIARNMLDFARLVEQDRIKIISATEAFPDNPAGNFALGVQALTSRLYSEQLSERASLGMATKASKGIWPSYAPIGYINDRNTRTIVLDPERAPIIRRLFEIYAYEDVPLSRLTQMAKDMGLRTRGGGTLSKTSLYNLLQNPIYCGIIRWKGALYPGTHEPIISKELFDLVQARLHGRSKTKGRPYSKHRYPFRGLLRCGYCGCVITAGTAKKKYVYYRCTYGRGKCPQPYIREDRLAARLREVVERVHLPREMVEFLLGEIKRSQGVQNQARLARIRVLKTKLHRIKGRRDQAYMDKLDGKISEGGGLSSSGGGPKSNWLWRGRSSGWRTLSRSLWMTLSGLWNSYSAHLNCMIVNRLKNRRVCLKR